MITPLIILTLLIAPWLGYHYLSNEGAKGGIYGLILAFLFFASGHFLATEGMVEMLPDFIPQRRMLVFVTGIWELLLVAGLAFRSTRRLAAKACLTTLVLFFPINIYAAFHSTGMGGHQWGPAYLFIRAPLQAFLIYWTWRFGLRREADIDHYDRYRVVC